MGTNWLGEAVGEEGYGSVEIDESEIIGNSNTGYWMFGIVNKNTKDARVYCVFNDSSKNKLLPIKMMHIVLRQEFLRTVRVLIK